MRHSILGNNKDKGVLSWEMRYSIAVGIAEALYYLHKECPQPVIHRDIKTSNILLSDGFEPKVLASLTITKYSKYDMFDSDIPY